MIEIKNKSGEPVVLGFRGISIELNPDETYELQGYQPTGLNAPQLEVLTMNPARDPATPRSPQGWLGHARPDEGGPKRSSRERQL